MIWCMSSLGAHPPSAAGPLFGAVEAVAVNGILPSPISTSRGSVDLRDLREILVATLVLYTQQTG